MTADEPEPIAEPETRGLDFIRTLVLSDLAAGRNEGRVVTRFPPEPNGYLHIGHAKSICLNFGLAREHAAIGAVCHLRFDDTNPLTEEDEYVRSIQRDVRWLGFDWGDRLFFASDYFERLYEKAEELVEQGLAYVDDQSEEEIRTHRGTVTEPGRESPWRNRKVAENLDLLRRMRVGAFEDGSRVLRAKIDMRSPNMLMRDPILYRIRHAHHHRRGDEWCIYPMYDFTHCLSDAFEAITHSLCTLEFENNREIYDWVLDHVTIEARPRQIEFARLNLSYTVLSKRRLLELVRDGHVDGWDDPRMPTLSGMRRRGVPAAAIRDFCDRIGVAKANSLVDVALLEYSIRDTLNTEAPRVLVVLDPLPVVVENYPEGEVEWLDAPSWPHDVGKPGSRELPFGRELAIERDDFRLDPPAGFRRLAPGREVRLRYGYVIRCERAVVDESGEVVELRCTYDPATRGGEVPDGRKVAGTIHWVATAEARPVEVRLYDRLFLAEQPSADKSRPFTDTLNPDSLRIVPAALAEPSLAEAEPGSWFQFERLGYFYLDPEHPEGAVFNRVVTLRDTWSRRRDAPTPAPTPVASPEPVPEPEARDPLAELDEERRRIALRYHETLDLPTDHARILAAEPELVAFFEAARAVHDAPVALAAWIANELLRVRKSSDLAALPFGPTELGELVALVDEGVVSATGAKELFAVLASEGGRPRAIVAARGLAQLSDEEALGAIVADVVARHPDQVAAYRAGKTALLGFFVGQVMKATKGRANPQLATSLLELLLAAP